MAQLIVTAGPGHGHNELLSWLLNHNGTIYSDYDYKWQLYPGEFGTYLRICDGWNIKPTYPEYNRLYHERLRHGTDSYTTSDMIDEIKKQVDNLWETNVYLSQYLNCMNLEHVIEHAHRAGLPVVTCKADIATSKHRSSFAQMEFSVHGAQTETYENHSLQTICRWLSVKDHRQENYHELDIDCVVSSNEMLTDDRDEFQSMLDRISNSLNLHAGWNPQLWDKMQYIKMVNTPIHPVMQELDRMSWEEIENVRYGR